MSKEIDLNPANIKAMQGNVYSQYGEDGVIEWVFSRLAPRHRMCVEFGAWDGRNISNTFNLVEKKGWKAVYIEADAEKYKDLQKTAAEFPAIAPVHGFVAATGDYSLDSILERQGFPPDFDLLSIDVDGSDYDIWEGMIRFQPALVVIEHNSGLPPNIDYVDVGGRSFTGSSAAALSRLAEKKGYGLLGCTFSNCIFLRVDLFPSLGVRPQTVAEAFDASEVCYVTLNFAGELVFSNAAIAAHLRQVSYRSRLKTLTRRLLGMPTFYVLGRPHAESGVVMNLLRRAAAWVQG